MTRKERSKGFIKRMKQILKMIKAEGNKAEVARDLGISRARLNQMLKKYREREQK